jgi:DNA primase
MRMPEGKDPDDVIKEDIEAWSKLEAEAQPVIDYVINIATAGLDLARAKDRTLAVDKLGPVIAGMNDAIRRAGYLQKLAELVKVEAKQLETVIGRNNPKPKTRESASSDTDVSSRIRRRMLTSPVEEYCLALLIQHPELRVKCEAILTDYFEDSSNQVILGALLGGEEGEIEDKLAPEIREKIDQLKARTLPEDSLEQKFTACVLRLREKYLRNREVEKEAVLALEMESGGTIAELTKLREQGIEGSSELKKVFDEKARRRGRPENK